MVGIARQTGEVVDEGEGFGEHGTKRVSMPNGGMFRREVIIDNEQRRIV